MIEPDRESATDLPPGIGGPWLADGIEDRSRLLSMPFGRVFVCDVGPIEGADAPPLVFLHGLFVTHHAFNRLIPLLAANRRIVAIDLPGAGDSDHPAPAVADDYSLDWLASVVLQVTTALALPRFEMVGHDFGGAVALAFVAAHASAVCGLRLLAPVAMTVSLPLTGSLAIVPALGVEVFKRVLRKADIERFLVQGLSTRELLCAADVNVYWDRLGRLGARTATFAMLGQLPSLVRLRDAIRSIEVPTQIIWGDRDAIVDVEQGERLLSLLQHGTLEVIEGCGHNPADERAAEVAALLSRPSR